MEITQRIKQYKNHRGIWGLELQVKTPSGEWVDKDYIEREATEYRETYAATLETPPEYEASEWEDEETFYDRALGEFGIIKTDNPWDGDEYIYTHDIGFGIIYKTNEEGELVEELDDDILNQ